MYEVLVRSQSELVDTLIVLKFYIVFIYNISD